MSSFIYCQLVYKTIKFNRSRSILTDKRSNLIVFKSNDIAASLFKMSPSPQHSDSKLATLFE